MAPVLGLVQTRGIGDIVIALPIAAYYRDRGYAVVWPVDERYVSFLTVAAPWIRFLPVPHTLAEPDYYFFEPLRLLSGHDCERVYSLYSKLLIPGVDVVDRALAESLTFDQYKYALTGVPFREKWNLSIGRDREREEKLFRSLGLRGRYVCVHGEGHENAFEFALPEAWTRECEVVRIRSRTDSPFDWLRTLEGAERLVLVDSCFSNLVEQLGMTNEKYFLMRSTAAFTPVLRNDWWRLAVQPGPPPGPVSSPWAWTVPAGGAP